MKNNMKNVTELTVQVALVQRTALGEGPDRVEQLALEKAEADHPGHRAVAVRWLGADAFDRWLGGRWVELEVRLAA
jgi:hypothetical protein